MTTTTPVKGCDYSLSRPNLTQLKTAGIKFVVRYLSPGTNPKNLTKPELTGLLAAGLHVCVVFESSAGRILAGHSAGVSDAVTADEELKALNLAGLPVYFACDVDPRPFTTAQWTVAMAYLDGVASVIGHARTGGYGGLAFIKRAFDAKKITYGWQAYAWSDGAWDPRAQLRQTKNGVSLAGGTVDLDEAHALDYGQWPRPVTDPGPFRHVVPAGNTLTLAKVAADRGTTVDHIAEVTTAAADYLHLAVFDEYLGLCRALRAVDLPRAVMPEGMVYWTTNP
jgi:hypothetical protein